VENKPKNKNKLEKENKPEKENDPKKNEPKLEKGKQLVYQNNSLKIM
jgi:hypothetical protein